MRVITLTIMDDGVYRGLRHHAGQNGRTVEEEAAEIIAAAVPSLPPGEDEIQTGTNMLKALRSIAELLGGMELELPPRHCCENTCSNWQQGCRCNSNN